LLSLQHLNRIDDVRSELARDGDRLVERDAVRAGAREHDPPVDRGHAETRLREALPEVRRKLGNVVGNFDIEDADQLLAFGINRDPEQPGSPLLCQTCIEPRVFFMPALPYQSANPHIASIMFSTAVEAAAVGPRSMFELAAGSVMSRNHRASDRDKIVLERLDSGDDTRRAVEITDEGRQGLRRPPPLLRPGVSLVDVRRVRETIAMTLRCPKGEVDDLIQSFRNVESISRTDEPKNLPSLPPQVDCCDALVDLFHGNGEIVAQYLRRPKEVLPFLIWLIGGMLDPNGDSELALKICRRRRGKPSASKDQLFSLGAKVETALPSARNKVEEAVKQVANDTGLSRTKVYRGWSLFKQNRELLDKH
jgi:hypothetical protein